MSPIRLVPQRALPVLIGLLAVFTGPLPTAAQTRPDTLHTDTTNLGPRLEPILDALSTTDRTATLAAEQLANLKAQPLALNRASVADLSMLPRLTSRDAHRIVQYRTDNGPFTAVEDLRAVDGIGPAAVQSVRPFLQLEETASRSIFPPIRTITSNLRVRLTQRYTRRLDLGRGFREDRFLGPPGRLTTRLQLAYERRLQLALTLDKDPGEPLRWSPQTQTYGFDHITGSLALRDLGRLETLVLGDFTAQFGQGVALWQGLRFGKGRDPIAPAHKRGRGVRPYHSASETSFFRGAAATIGLPGELSLTAFASRRRRDASVDSSSAAGTGPLPVRTVSGGGQHRTPSELARKGTFGETTLGGALAYRRAGLHLGVTGYRARFSRPLRPGDRPYRRFRVTGDGTSMLGGYGTVFLGDYTVFGDVARSPRGSFGGLLGAALDGDYAEAVVVGRRYPPDFASFYGNAFGDGSRPQNEMGVYTGLQLQLAPKWSVGAYLDQYRAPWLQFNVPRPSTGWEARVVLDYAPRPWLSSYVQVRVQDEDEGTEYRRAGRSLEGLQRKRRYSTRWHTEYLFSDALTVRTRLELSLHTTPDARSNGFFLSQGLRWSPHPTLTADVRIAFFDTDGFPARIYAYEHDLRYSFSAPVFFDRGRRAYALVRYEPFSSLALEAKYGVTRYDNRTTIGSGLNQIEGSRRREVRLQVHWTP
ncbi:DNA uptake protein ComE-like DNA-binding protein [Salinibacter ruber]|uniref:helix-hairpin-helix domain-containing protein n=1 Tax=Salinibacter ruber TaxID=146919 RepID=UPI002167E3F0|nr:helix-hairpin-helix domain-containing protein [Salinibacter ruber]MCS3626527.1 DNA uptake protein ComE-like DNA-binding protein [Salinibacter ruber]MCS4143637.1 DNA uptake protein ComE-like DNA-binding protein [Salinibacter ruber]